jgi:hypothetical protein
MGMGMRQPEVLSLQKWKFKLKHSMAVICPYYVTCRSSGSGFFAKVRCVPGSAVAKAEGN